MIGDPDGLLASSAAQPIAYGELARSAYAQSFVGIGAIPIAHAVCAGVGAPADLDIGSISDCESLSWLATASFLDKQLG